MANAFDNFCRDISYRVFNDDGRIGLTATMKDVFHDIVLEVRVDPETMVIVSALVNFRKHPTDFCPRIDAAMQKLANTVIGKGMNRRLMEIFGGSEGCGNIRTMLQGLLPLALNARAAAGIEDQEEMLDKISRELTGTCVGYPRN